MERAPTAACEGVRRRLGEGGPLAPPGAAHLSKCLSCQEIEASFRALDALLSGEPAPPAPRGLAAAVRLALDLRQAEARRLRWAGAASLVAAAAALALAVALGLPALDAVEQQATAWIPDVGLAWTAWPEGLLDRAVEVRGALHAAASDALTQAPAPPWIALLLAAPLLALLNWILSRGGQAQGVRR